MLPAHFVVRQRTFAATVPGHFSHRATRVVQTSRNPRRRGAARARAACTIGDFHVIPRPSNLADVGPHVAEGHRRDGHADIAAL